MISASLYDDPTLYDLLLDSSAGIAFYEGLAKTQGGRVLDLACGTGRYAIPLAEMGFDVTGVDLSASMLAHAKAKADAASVGLRLIEADMRSLDLGAERFSLIFIGGNSLLHLHREADFQSFFAGVRRHLAPGGVLAFDIFSPAPRLLAREPDRRYPVGRVHHPELGAIRIEETVLYDAAAQVTQCRWYWSTDREPDFRMTAFHLRSIFPQELRFLLAAGGLALHERFGDFQRSPFGATSGQQVCVCRLANEAA